MDAWLILRALHLLAIAFFVGGQLMLAAVLVPVARGTETMRVAARRFGVGTLVALFVLLVTGIPLAQHYDSFDDGTLHVKLGVAVLTGILIVLHMRRPGNHALEGLIFLGSIVTLYLGVVLAHG